MADSSAADQPAPPAAWKTVKLNFPGTDYKVFVDLAARSGTDIDTAASRAVTLLMTQRIYRAHGDVPDAAMVAASEKLFPTIVANPRNDTPPWHGHWYYVNPTLAETDYVYLNTRPGGDFDIIAMTLRDNLLSAARLAGNWLAYRENALRATGPEPPAKPAVGGLNG